MLSPDVMLSPEASPDASKAKAAAEKVGFHRATLVFISPDASDSERETASLLATTFDVGERVEVRAAL